MATILYRLKGYYCSFKYMVTETSLFDNPGFYDHAVPWYRVDKKYGLMIFALMIAAIIAWWVFTLLFLGYAVYFGQTMQRMNRTMHDIAWNNLTLEEQKARLFQKRPEVYDWYHHPSLESNIIQWNDSIELKQLYDKSHPLDGIGDTNEIPIIL